MAKHLIHPVSKFHFHVFAFFPPFLLLPLCTSIGAVLIFFFPQVVLFSFFLKAYLTPVSVVDISKGCLLDRPVTTLLARETHQYIATLLPLLICRGTLQGGREGEEVKRRGK